MNKNKKHIWIGGQFVEVSEEVYAAYRKGERKMRYFENDLKTERVFQDKDGYHVIPSREDSLDRLMESGTEQFADLRENVEDIVLRKFLMDRLCKAVAELTKAEQRLIYAVFIEKKTERDIASLIGVSQSAVHKQKNRILKKLKLFLEI